MTERDADATFELRLAEALRRYAADAPTDVEPSELVHALASRQPRARATGWPWASGLSPAVAWLLLVAALVVTLAAAVAVGASLLRLRELTVLPAPSATPAAVVDRAADPIGDATGDMDIVAVTTTTTVGGALTLEIELADDWPDADSLLHTWLVPDGDGACNPWLTDYALHVQRRAIRLSPSRMAELRLGAWLSVRGSKEKTLDYGVDGPRLTIVIPLALFGDPDTLGVGVETPGSDDFPDDVIRCHTVHLAAASGAP